MCMEFHEPRRQIKEYAIDVRSGLIYMLHVYVWSIQKGHEGVLWVGLTDVFYKRLAFELSR